MNKKAHSTKGGKQSFWTTVPGILTALAAVITAVGGLLAALHTAGLINPEATQAPIGVASSVPTTVAQAATGVASSVPTISAQPSVSGPSSVVGTTSGDCFEQYFQGVPSDRVHPLESGAEDFELIRPDQTRGEPVGIRFTDFGQPIGAIKFQYFPETEVFKVYSVVDVSCAAIEDYSNASSGGAKNVLQNYDVLQMRLGNADYQLRLMYDMSLSVVFKKISP